MTKGIMAHCSAPFPARPPALHLLAALASGYSQCLRRTENFLKGFDRTSLTEPPEHTLDYHKLEEWKKM